VRPFAQRGFLDRFTDEHGERSLPAYIERELCAVITWGDVAHGFVGCVVRVVPSTCSWRSRAKDAGCPSCGGRRMAVLAAHLVDEVFPDVPTRQWVLSMPIALRLHLAADPDLLRDVASALIDAAFASYARGARAVGLLDTPSSFAHPGAVPLL
jgi:hypothetical protein